ncbi:MAG TPA: toll/interleukin-1 receptor domain-containing protein [bacterium]|nr:toll/interleukin-1 receptor domain-containing protein [bacterium]
MRTEPPIPSLTSSIWPHIIIPYGYTDHEFAHKLAAELRRDQVSRWIEELDMSAGKFVVNWIAHSVRPVDIVIAVVSASSVTASWVQHDLGTVMAREFNGRHVTLLLARTDSCALPDTLASQPCFDFRDEWNRAYDDLLVAIQRFASQRLASRHPTTNTRRPR